MVWAGEPTRVVVTIPVLKDLTEQIGGDRVVVKSLLTGFESPHTYGPKPSDLTALQEARLFIEVGAGLEIWVKGLLKNARHPDLLIITTSRGIPLLRDANHRDGNPTEREREPRESQIPVGEKDRHTLGNPHIWLDPENVKIMMRHITEGLSQVAPSERKTFLQNQGNYFKRLEALESEIQKGFEGLPNKKIISYHPAWPYFARRFGITIAGDIQTQVGSEPSAKHMAELVGLIRKQGIKVIVSEPQLNPKIPQMLSQESGARLILLTYLPGVLPGTEDYISMMRYNALKLAEALKE
jgi:ABC-type Zn uptake system ZnuABC Zn-binding protein ZnuA